MSSCWVIIYTVKVKTISLFKIKPTFCMYVASILKSLGESTCYSIKTLPVFICYVQRFYIFQYEVSHEDHKLIHMDCFQMGCQYFSTRGSCCIKLIFSHDADLSPADRDKVVMPLGELHICKAFFPSQKRRKKQTFRSSNSVLHLLLSRKFSRQTSLLVALWLCSLNELAEFLLL